MDDFRNDVRWAFKEEFERVEEETKILKKETKILKKETEILKKENDTIKEGIKKLNRNKKIPLEIKNIINSTLVR